jgi:hypothetical protein
MLGMELAQQQRAKAVGVAGLKWPLAHACGKAPRNSDGAHVHHRPHAAIVPQGDLLNTPCGCMGVPNISGSVAMVVDPGSEAARNMLPHAQAESAVDNGDAL